MINPFRKGILFGTVVSAIVAVAGIVVIFVLITAYITAADTQKFFTKHLDELLDTVESTASVACFSKINSWQQSLLPACSRTTGWQALS